MKSSMIALLISVVSSTNVFAETPDLSIGNLRPGMTLSQIRDVIEQDYNYRGTAYLAPMTNGEEFVYEYRLDTKPEIRPNPHPVNTSIKTTDFTRGADRVEIQVSLSWPTSGNRAYLLWRTLHFSKPKFPSIGTLQKVLEGKYGHPSKAGTLSGDRGSGGIYVLDWSFNATDYQGFNCERKVRGVPVGDSGCGQRVSASLFKDPRSELVTKLMVTIWDYDLLNKLGHKDLEADAIMRDRIGSPPPKM